MGFVVPTAASFIHHCMNILVAHRTGLGAAIPGSNPASLTRNSMIRTGRITVKCCKIALAKSAKEQIFTIVIFLLGFSGKFFQIQILRE